MGDAECDTLPNLRHNICDRRSTQAKRHQAGRYPAVDHVRDGFGSFVKADRSAFTRRPKQRDTIDAILKYCIRMGAEQWNVQPAIRMKRGKQSRRDTEMRDVGPTLFVGQL